MDEIYEGIFESRYRGRRIGPVSLRRLHQTSGAVRDIIEYQGATVSQMGKYLRSDAKHLIYVNSMEMVAKPLDLAHRWEPESIEGMLSQDIDLVISDAAERVDQEVSAHSIIDALSRSWSRLSIGELGTWE